MKRLITIILFFPHLFLGFATADDYLETIPLNGNECVASVAALKSGDIIAAGVDLTSNDVLLLKLSAAGTLLRAQRIAASGIEEAQAVVATSDGGAVVVGSTNSFGEGNTDGFILKLRRSGTIAWKRTFGTSGNEHLVKIIQTSDRGFIVLGDADHDPNLNDIVIAKFSSRGRPVWRRVISAAGFDHASDLGSTSDGGAIVAIAADFPEGVRSVLVKVSGNGSVEWSRIYGSRGSHVGLSVVETVDGSGDYYFTEIYTPSGSQRSGTVLSRLDSSGIPLWTRVYKTRGASLAATIGTFENDNILMSGNTTSPAGGNSQGVLIGLDKDGRILWRKKVKPDARPVFIGDALILTTDNSIIAAGCAGEAASNDMDSMILKIQENGNIAGGCSKLTSFPLSGKRFSLPNSPFTIEQIEVPFFTASPGFQINGLSSNESPVCSSP
jgi:hypothetical protein